MTRTENEQELVLGNKQLLSAFFVVVALLGVFFTMGYVVGRNSASAPIARDTVKTAPPATETDAPGPVAQTPDPVTPPAPEPVRPQIEEGKTAETKPARTPPPAPVEETPAAPAATTPSGLQYLQVMAVKRPVADNIVKVLKERGFPALLGESSKPELFRVLVGPYSDTPSLAAAKTKLKAAGFDSVVSK